MDCNSAKPEDKHMFVHYHAKTMHTEKLQMLKAQHEYDLQMNCLYLEVKTQHQSVKIAFIKGICAIYK